MRIILSFLFADRRAAILLAGLATVLALTGCGKAGGGGPPPDPAIEVVMQKPSVETVEDTLAAVGTIEANERIELKPETAGLIEAIYFDEGQRASKGKKLFELGARKEAAAVEQAKAEEQLARMNADRARSLAGTKAISQLELDRIESEVAVRAATRKVEEEVLADRIIAAPFDGVLGQRLVSPGEYVNAGTPLVTLVDDFRVKVRFRIPERELSLARLQQEGRLRVSAYPGRAFTGQVDLISPEIDQVTRTAEIRLIVPNADQLLKAGMFAHVELITGSRPNALVIPEGALVPSLNDFSVFTVQSNVAHLARIKIGVRLPGKVEVREGLTAGQDVVVSGTQKIVDGMKVVAASPLAPSAGQQAPETTSP